jgi:hypothetical protein
MKTLSYTLCAVLAAGIESDGTTKEDRNHFYFRRLFLGGHAKMGDNWGGDVVMDFAASPNSDSTA